MARWKLACSHYLMTVRPAKWRYSHTDRTTGELVEKEFLVPRMLDINDPKCWTNRSGNPVSRGGNDMDAEGEVVVCIEGKGERGDIAFLGDPTPDMIPLDEEAQKISDSFQERWAYKPDQPEQSFSQAMVNKADFTPAPVEIAGIQDLVGAMTMMIQQNQAIIQSLAESKFHRV